MVAELLQLDKSRAEKLNALLRLSLLANGIEPETRLILCGLSWQRYLALDKALGHDRPSPRFYYLDGDLEIMTTSDEHERIKTWLGDFLADYFRENRIRVAPRGQATMRARLKEAGAEPDESWCIGENKRFPDLVLEIALSSGGLPKLAIYGRLGIREVWFWRKTRIEVFCLKRNGQYEQMTRSRLLPKLNLLLLQRCVGIPDWLDAMDAFQSGDSKSQRKK